MDALTRATNEINQALKRLEQETGQFVQSIDLRNIDVTGLHAPGTQLSRSVVIEILPIPGSLWEVR